MMYNSKLGPHPGKLKLRYFGPYRIVEEVGQRTFKRKDVFETPIPKPVNGFRMKKFYGKVPDIPKWMVNKAEDIAVKYVEIEMESKDESEWRQQGCQPEMQGVC